MKPEIVAVGELERKFVVFAGIAAHVDGEAIRRCEPAKWAGGPGGVAWLTRPSSLLLGRERGDGRRLPRTGLKRRQVFSQIGEFTLRCPQTRANLAFCGQTLSVLLEIVIHVSLRTLRRIERQD